MNLDDYSKTSAIIISAKLYQEAIQNRLRAFNSGMEQVSTTKHWKLTVTYSYNVNGEIFFTVKTIMANELTNDLFKKLLGKPDIQDLQQLMLEYTPGSTTRIHYRSSRIEESYLPGMGKPSLAKNVT
ncbi:hypothetical protein [Rheinheimera maricola]|uniref:hypothetical protein n=1 Tax=Rheinheimera maricola TaxID=2793282 RepID=UPI001963C84B|nr:hypothetical protein [Rheinheimera maricola]